MKKSFLIFFLCPLLTFASFDYNGYTFDRVKVFTWLAPASTQPSGQAPLFRADSPDQIFDIYISNPFGLSISYSGSSSTFVVPADGVSSRSFFVEVTSSAKVNITNSLYAVSNDFKYAVSPAYFSRVKGLFFVASGLYVSGYRGPGVTEVFSNSFRADVNFYFPDLISGVLCSTNNVFRQMLLNSLSSISDSSSLSVSFLSSIDSSIAASSSSLSSIDSNIVASASFLSSMDSNTVVVSSSLSSIDSNIVSSASSLSSIDSSSAASSSFLSLIAPPSVEELKRQLQSIRDQGAGEGFNFDNVLQALDRGNWDSDSSFDPVYDFWASQYQRGIPSVVSFLAALDSFQPLGSSSKGLSAVGDLLNSSVRSNLNGIKSSVDSLSSYSSDPNSPGYRTLSGDPAVPPPHNPLDLTDPNNPRNPDSIYNSNNPNFIGGGGAFGGFVTNYVTRPLGQSISNATEQAADVISTNAALNSAQEQAIMNKILDLLERLTSPDPGDGIAASVRIADPVHNGRVLVDTGLESFDPSAYNWKELIDGISVVARIPDLTNLVDMVDYTSYLEQLVSNTAPWRLWTDYEEMVNGSFSAIVAHSLSGDLLSSFNNQAFLGDNFWTYFTSISGRQASDIHSIAFLFTNVSSVIEFANSTDWGSDSDGGEKNMFSVAREVLSSFPSKTAIEDYISQATNSSSLVTSSTNFLSQVLSTNEASKIIDDFFVDRGSSLPSQFVLLKLASPSGNDFKVFDIPINEQAALWSTLRASITVVFTLVNLLLLPKFVLMVFRLFIRLFNRSLPFLDTKQ